MRHVTALAALVLFLFLADLSSAKGGPPDDPKPVNKPPPEPQRDWLNNPYWGVVTEITKTSITVQFRDDKPKTFPVSETLAAGKIPMEPRLWPGQKQGYHVSPMDMYRVTDVKVGDWVVIHYAHLGGVNICDHICIDKRPGGRVPPLPEEAEARRRGRPRPPDFPLPPYIRYDEFTNAFWDLEDKGIPFPEKFGKSRRWPLAPMPREVKPPGPAIAP